MRSIAFAVLAAGWCLVTQDAAAQVEGGQAALARDLLSEDRSRVARAVGLLPLVWPAHGEEVVWAGSPIRFPEGYEITTELAEALVVALEREKRLAQQGDPYGELNLALLGAVAATRHPVTVDILMRTQWGSESLEALLYFGPGVLPDVVELARSPEASPYETWGALRVLEEAMERWDKTVGPEIREAVKEVAILHLEGPPDSFTSVREASETLRDFLFDHAVALAKGALAPPADPATDEDGRLRPEGLGPFADQIVDAMGTRAEREARAPYSPRWWPLEVGDTISWQRWWALESVEVWNGLPSVFWLDTLVFRPVYLEVFSEGDPLPFLGVSYEGHFPRKSHYTPDWWWHDLPAHLEGESAADVERWLSDPDNSYPDWGATAAEKAMWTRERWLEGWTGSATEGGSG